MQGVTYDDDGTEPPKAKKEFVKQEVATAKTEKELVFFQGDLFNEKDDQPEPVKGEEIQPGPVVKDETIKNTLTEQQRKYLKNVANLDRIKKSSKDSYNNLLKLINDIPQGVEVLPLGEVAGYAYSNISFDREKRGFSEELYYLSSIIEMYNNYFDKIKNDKNKIEVLISKINNYAKKINNLYCDYLHAKSRTASSFITGPANFPTARNQKRLNSESNKYDAVINFEAKTKKYIEKDLGLDYYSKNVISSDDSNAIEKLQNRIAKLEKRRDQFKEINKIIRSKKLTNDEKIEKIKESFKLSKEVIQELLTPAWNGKAGFQSFEISSLTRKIAEAKKRLILLERMQSEKTSEKIINNVKIVDNVEENRLQLFFNGKPNEETRKKLKANGFRWAPSQKAWMLIIKLSKSVRIYNTVKSPITGVLFVKLISLFYITI
ncbi:hypothetical protein AAEX28_04650 [Lentisphaerota bacterium WC36G]|nr:hypothetical protein LJT99_07285 [Lentisphaerae bacterium WC36]UDQ99377.1 hypothetical protein LJT99_07510 [Lentisphaerae bacterium WC36]